MIVGTRIVEVAYVYRVRGVRAGARKVREWDALGTVPCVVEILDPASVETFGMTFEREDDRTAERDGIVLDRRFLQPFQVSFSQGGKGPPPDLTFDLAVAEIALLRTAMASRHLLGDLTFHPSRSLHPEHVRLLQDLRFETPEAVHLLDGDIPEPLWTNEEEARRLAVEAGRGLYAVGDVIHGSRWEPTIVHGEAPGFHDVDLLSHPESVGWDDLTLSGSRSTPPASRVDRHLPDERVDWRFDDAGVAVSVCALKLARDLSSWSRRRGPRASVLAPALYRAVRSLHDDAVRIRLGDLPPPEAARRLVEGWKRMMDESGLVRERPETAGLVTRTYGVEIAARIRHLLWLLPRIDQDAREASGDMDALAGAI